MVDPGFAALGDLVRRPGIGAEGAAAEIHPVHGGLFDANGNSLLISSVGLLSSTTGALAAVRNFFSGRWQPGDVALTNDMDAGAINACEIVTVAPIHSGITLLGWSVVRGRIPDFGGWEPGGYSPQAVDRWAEGARLEPVKVIAAGRYRREVTDLLQLNSRTPQTTLLHVRLLADAAVALGHAYALDHVTFDDTIAALRAAERRRASAAIGELPAALPTQRSDVAVPWSNEQFGAIEVQIANLGDALRVTLAGPPIANRPINLGRFAAKDIVLAAVASACRLDDLLTDSLHELVKVTVEESSLLAAPLPATVGLGRQTSGKILFRATAAALGLYDEQAEGGWRNYRDKACGGGFDAQTGKLATAMAAQIRVRQAQEVAA